ncbi:RmlC-like cupin domain-containing protein [Trichophaea hybrida]|nr:RmlC-like cupin domain-containing protein [Trichophaea hybrida]
MSTAAGAMFPVVFVCRILAPRTPSLPLADIGCGGPSWNRVTAGDVSSARNPQPTRAPYLSPPDSMPQPPKTTSPSTRTCATERYVSSLLFPPLTPSQIWFGDHPKNPSTTLDGTPLSTLISTNPSKYLSSGVYNRFKQTHDSHLLYLFKVLSSSKALPAQAHPYRKPEVAVTISDHFDGFLGFRLVWEIKSFLKHVPELRTVLKDHETVEKFLNTTDDDGEATRRLLKRRFSELLSVSHTEIAACSQQLHTHVTCGWDEALGDLGRQEGLKRVIEKVLTDYPEDGRGSRCRRIVSMRILKGIMARSDNMIACGFATPEEQVDPKTFVDHLSYDTSEPKKYSLHHETWKKSGHGRTQIYNTLWDEFDLLYTKLEAGEEETVEQGIEGPTVFMVTNGSVVLRDTAGLQQERLEEGKVVFVKPGNGYRIMAVDQEAEVWGSFVET